MRSAPGTEPDLVDVRDMIVVHTALLREFRLAPGLVRDAGGGSAASAAAVADHIEFLLDMLHHHHAGEDQLLWPKLRERLPTELDEIIDLMETQHDQLDTTIDQARSAVRHWATTLEDTTRDRAADSLDRLHHQLAEHLHEEEQHVLPLAAANLTSREWNEIGEAGVAAIPKRKLPLVFGMLMYEGDPAVTRSMLAAAPALPRLLVPYLALRAYARYARRIHGIRTP